MRPIWIGTGVVLASTLVLDVAFRHLAHAEYPWHTWPAFDFVYGLFGCAAIVYVSKWLGRRFLQRDESYYEDEP